jgi:hypothetical protein
MLTHSSSCLPGPLSKSRIWWQNLHFHQKPEEHKPTTPTQPASEEPEFRADLVARIRREIADGTYDTPEKWEKALDNLARRLGEE